MGTISWIAKEGINYKARTWTDQAEFDWVGEPDKETVCLIGTPKQPEEQAAAVQK